MSIIWKPLVAGTLLTATADLYYTATGSNVTATITQASLYNKTAAAVDVFIYLVPSGGSAGDPTTVVKKNVAAGASASVPELIDHKLANGGKIYAKGLDVSLTISGAEHA
ncbi:hypothetical protein C7416_104477 [Cupriavidus phytorum]|uniref:Uncharacterized protein n=1 Tax=Cupriavidus phytorum TaxID=3024399 RepID=A0A2W7QV04_9BURK|nr:hypothetical protein [Cupriavidus alkaliphilus]PZX29472.1 hypothetical protein C7416_104477 [Cupriavidus alkaliphilus]